MSDCGTESTLKMLVFAKERLWTEREEEAKARRENTKRWVGSKVVDFRLYGPLRTPAVSLNEILGLTHKRGYSEGSCLLAGGSIIGLTLHEVRTAGLRTRTVGLLSSLWLDEGLECSPGGCSRD